MELKDLKVGDLVVLNDTYIEKLAPIQRITNTLIIAHNTKFRKSTGVQVGERMLYHESISIPSEDDIKRIKKEMDKRKMTDTIYIFAERARREQVSFENLEKVYDVIVSLKK